MKQQRQNIILEQQGFQLKSEAALSPLAELNTQLKDVIAALPEDAKLNSLQSQLSKVSSDIAGLGAINLAAIEEFDKAFERKNYLDQQYDDLISALDTLETAIVKIDRETKQRFKATFDQVIELYGIGSHFSLPIAATTDVTLGAADDLSILMQADAVVADAVAEPPADIV